MLENVNSFIQTTIGNMPVAVLTIALLATPTILYFIYRFSVGTASHGRSRTSVTPAAQWVCPSCRSVNELTARRCYRCGLDVEAAEDLLVIDPITAKPISPDAEPGPAERPAVPVGPGIAVPVMSAASAMPSSAAMPAAPTVQAAQASTTSARPANVPGPASAPPTTMPGSPGVPVGPGRPAPVPVRSARSTPSDGGIGAAVGARRPYDLPPAPDVPNAPTDG